MNTIATNLPNVRISSEKMTPFAITWFDVLDTISVEGVEMCLQEYWVCIFKG